MIKMFTTQLTGLFNRIQANEEYTIEDSARLLAQAAIGEGHIYIKGYNEMEAIMLEALEGKEPLSNARKLDDFTILTEADRVLIVSRYATDSEALELATELNQRGIPFVAVSGVTKEDGENLVDFADFHIDTKVIKGLLPNEIGERVGFPSSMAALYIYFAIKFTLEEIVEEVE
ncbi:putative phosphosugar-binding protein [Bacillus pakistanensis]|uniref:Phosphosugar-binding protein n=2 Tax=Rossellomorea pakistanensis TaxID=992288 RepID=A0ABS2NBI7_9BACI|nr:DUF2529 domain-containing protein [Bacillus pakistanensis]MBM7585232.1 putative phosphosugar-binding protein [Bacillus pakistanensis]